MSSFPNPEWIWCPEIPDRRRPDDALCTRAHALYIANSELLYITLFICRPGALHTSLEAPEPTFHCCRGATGSRPLAVHNPLPRGEAPKYIPLHCTVPHSLSLIVIIFFFHLFPSGMIFRPCPQSFRVSPSTFPSTLRGLSRTWPVRTSDRSRNIWQSSSNDTSTRSDRLRARRPPPRSQTGDDWAAAAGTNERA